MILWHLTREILTPLRGTGHFDDIHARHCNWPRPPPVQFLAPPAACTLGWYLEPHSASA